MRFVLLGTERVESLNLYMMPEVADIISSAGIGVKEAVTTAPDFDEARQLSQDLEMQKACKELVETFAPFGCPSSGKRKNLTKGISRLIHACASAADEGHLEKVNQLEKSNQDLTSSINQLQSKLATVQKANEALITLFVIAVGGTPPEFQK